MSVLGVCSVYHGALRFITDCTFSTHHCILYNRVAWSSLAVRRQMHWYLLIYKAILGSAFEYAALSDWNSLQMKLQLN